MSKDVPRFGIAPDQACDLMNIEDRDPDIEEENIWSADPGDGYRITPILDGFDVET